MYLTQSLHRAVQQHPDRVALRFANRQRTFREFADRVARLAGALQELDMQEGDRVAILSLNSDRYLEYQMAVPWAGGVLNPCNIRWSAAEILYSLEDSGSSILLVDETFRTMVEQFRRDSRTLRDVVYCGEGALPAGMHDYLAAFAYRFNRRFDLRTLVARLIVDVARCGPVKEKVIRAHAEARY